MSVKYRAHDTFFIRKGWLSKGVKNIIVDPAVFVSRDANPMDTLGMGANMVKALRYWLLAVGLTEEYKGLNNRNEQKLTLLGEMVHENDPYMEELGTLWLLHYRLAANKEDATAWYFFFNEFRSLEFTRDDFIIQTENYLRELDETVAERSIEDDYNCVINTYIPRIKLNPKKFDPEDNIDCPLGELGLIDIVNKKAKVYKKSSPKKDTLHPLILLAVILDQANGAREVRISEIQTNARNVGKVFNLDVIALTALLYKLEILGFIKVVRTAGLDVIKIETDLDFYGSVREYYRAING
ncbi:MAG: DUF4007 family protein [Gracilibacteraceae bacterium]|jgi:hypothetical protein|nr:DUF4007 family protein [Gracilibacteraceae bacterium]